MPITPGLTLEPKRKDPLNFGPKSIFLPLDEHKSNPNEKYLIAHDQFKKKDAPVLRFFSSLDDRGESPRDQMKFRDCHILYFVEDATIKVLEPRQRNAGFLQGPLISRNKIPKLEGGYYNLDDLNVGETVSLFGKSFKIYDCDPFTKNYLKEMGYRVGTPEPKVIDPVYADRQETDRPHTFKKKPYIKDLRLASFHKSFPKCLRFYVIYNNKPKHFEDVRYASLYYSIVDHTIKIIDEKKLQYYGRQLYMGNYDTCLILKPTLVPKKMRPCLIGENPGPVILNLSAPAMSMNIHKLMNTRSGGANNFISFLRDANPLNVFNENDYYSAKDFDLGITIDVFGREVYIYDCDEFTKEFYRDEFNKELIPHPLPEIKEVKYHQLVHREDIGNPEDSLQTCNQLATVNMPQQFIDAYKVSERPSHKGSRSDHLLNFYLNCRNGLDGKILRFLSRIITTDVFLKENFFLIQWYLEDDTISIVGLDLNFTISDSSDAEFMRRRKLTKPNSEIENAGSCFYSKTDMFIGNVIYAMMKPFLITDADDYTLEYMERNSDVFVQSNIKLISSKLYPVLREKITNLESSFQKYDKEKSGFIAYSDFKTVLSDVLPKCLAFPEQQIMTLARHFASEDYVGLELQSLISIIQAELKRQKFDDFEKLKTLFKIFDLDNMDTQGFFKPDKTYKILRSYPLLIDRDLLKSFIFKFPQENGLLRFENVVESLNYFENPVKPPDLSPYALNINWEKNERVKNLNMICYNSILKEITNENCPNCS